MLQCCLKSVFIVILGKFLLRLFDQRGRNSLIIDIVGFYLKVIIIYGIVELQCFDKLDWIKNCVQLVEYFVVIIELKNGRRDDVCLIFDIYDVLMLLREVIREKRYGGQDVIYYRIIDFIKNLRVFMKKFLLYIKIKMELVIYFIDKVMINFSRQGRR